METYGGEIKVNCSKIEKYMITTEIVLFFYFV
jgi:hypothetical protein